ncbi:MAG: polyhydroxyalkanoate synthesis repressor PhaR [Gammaproteobacteria bacterium]|nr:polyhydroxyalkanoate synthesis repressor PhaR [Gammaproteobacteria bacterium]
MSAPRTIKKYPNRRLYDTKVSSYITLADLHELVMQKVEFEVVDSNTGENLTRSILLQIILEEESGGEPLFSGEMLSHLIRLYGGTGQGMFARYLEESLMQFAKQQTQWQDNLGANPMESMTKMARSNMQMWADMQESFFKTTDMGFGSTKEKDQ